MSCECACGMREGAVFVGLRVHVCHVFAFQPVSVRTWPEFKKRMCVFRGSCVMASMRTCALRYFDLSFFPTVIPYFSRSFRSRYSRYFFKNLAGLEWPAHHWRIDMFDVLLLVASADSGNVFVHVQKNICMYLFTLVCMYVPATRIIFVSYSFMLLEFLASKD